MTIWIVNDSLDDDSKQSGQLTSKIFRSESKSLPFGITNVLQSTEISHLPKTTFLSTTNPWLMAFHHLSQSSSTALYRRHQDFDLGWTHYKKIVYFYSVNICFCVVIFQNQSGLKQLQGEHMIAVCCSGSEQGRGEEETLNKVFFDSEVSWRADEQNEKFGFRLLGKFLSDLLGLRPPSASDWSTCGSWPIRWSVSSIWRSTNSSCISTSSKPRKFLFSYSNFECT